jgi:hypothetical protein
MANERRLIDANALKQNIESRLKNGMIIGWLCSIVDDAKTVEAVEVVLCKDCKAYDKESYYCEAMGFTCEADDFCSYGERKDNERKAD